MSTEDLKKLAALAGDRIPTRNADIGAVIIRYLEGERVRAVWQGPDELQRAVVAEVARGFGAVRRPRVPRQIWERPEPGLERE